MPERDWRLCIHDITEAIAERWRAVKVTESERRQLAAVRQDLDQEYEARTGLKAKPSSEDPQIKIPAPRGLDP